jgi:hypothetical protein
LVPGAADNSLQYRPSCCASQPWIRSASSAGQGQGWAQSAGRAHGSGYSMTGSGDSTQGSGT